MAVLLYMEGCLDGLLFLATLYFTLAHEINPLYFHHKLPFSGTLFAFAGSIKPDWSGSINKIVWACAWQDKIKS